MDGETIFIWGIVIVFLLWMLTRNKDAGTIKKDVKETRKPQNCLAIDKPLNFEVTEEIAEVLTALENTNQNVFLTGKAGTGKSTLLSYFRSTSKKYPVVVAPTGVAAVNVQGQTIHSLFGWGIDITPERVRKISYAKSKIFRKLKVLIIDEISMVRADLFECVDKFLRLNTGKQNLPFGGVQVVVIGDLYQLPPVIKTQERKIFDVMYSSPFFLAPNPLKKVLSKNLI